MLLQGALIRPIEEKLKCSITEQYIYQYTQISHWPNEESVRQSSGRPGFNLGSSHTKDLKNGT